MNIMILILVTLISFIIISFLYMWYLHRKEEKALLEFPHLRSLKDQHVYMRLKEQGFHHYMVILFDVCRFRYVNELYGRSEGNRLISFIMEKSKESLEKNEEVIHRKDDQFIIFIHQDANDKIIQRIEEIQNKLRWYDPQQMNSYEVFVCVGVYRVNKSDNYFHAIQHAFYALKEAKGMGSGSICFYDENTLQKELRDSELEHYMNQALRQGEFELYLQPQIDLRTGLLIGAEALIRWNHSIYGILYPSEFIPLFEKNGFIHKLNQSILHQVCRFIKNWNEENMEPIHICINFSNQQAKKKDSIQQYVKIMQHYDISPKQIEIEISEQIIEDHLSLIKEHIEEMREWGLNITIENFGSGYSSLAHLGELDVDTLKLDKAFLQKTDNKNKQIISDLTYMAKHLSMKVIVEGVENKEQAIFLKAIGCDFAQGSYYGKAMSIHDFLYFANKKVESHKLDSTDETNNQ